MKLKKILVAVDFSDLTEKLLLAAKALKEKNPDAEIIVFHSIEKLPTDYNYWIFVETIDEAIREIKNQIKTKLESVASKYLDNYKIVIGEGNPTSEIRETARRRRVNLVIIGNHGRGGIEETLLGSTSEKVARKCNVPTLIIKPNEPVNFSRILIPVDFSVHSLQAMRKALEIFQPFSPQFYLLHVFEEPTFLYEGVVEIGTLEFFHRIEELEAEAENRIEKIVEEYKNKGFNIESIFIKGRPWEKILETAREKQVDLIAMSSHGSSETFSILMGSTAHKVITKCKCNVMIFKPNK